MSKHRSNGKHQGKWRRVYDGLQTRAVAIAQDKPKLAGLLAQATRRADSRRARGLIGGTVEDLRLLFRMLHAWLGGRYRVPWKTVVAAVGAVLYFVMPLDAIPDVIFAFGLLDDAAVIAFVVSRIRKDLDSFREWEQTPSTGS